VWTLQYLIKQLHLPTKRVTFILIKVNSCNALLRLLLVFINISLKSVLRYKFLILNTYHPDTLCEPGCEGPYLFYEAKKSSRAKTFAQQCIRGFISYYTLNTLCLNYKSHYVDPVEQCFSTSVRPRPGKFFFYKTRARSKQIYS